MIPQVRPGRFAIGPSRQIWDGLIARYGELALLRQPGLPDRWIMTCIGQFLAIERLGSVSNPADMKALVSNLDPITGLEISPDPSERDVMVQLKMDEFDNPLLDANGNPVEWQLLKIVAPPAPIGGSSKQLYWKLTVRR